MEAILKLLRKENKVVGEAPYFKYNHVRYYVHKKEDGSLEFWGHPTEKSSEGEPVQLGKYKNKKLTKPDNFYSLSMNYQRCAIRLWYKVGIYELNEKDKWWVGL